jgi:hypothetical protein
MTKICSQCEGEKDVEEDFHRRADGKPYPYCKACHRKYTKSHYQAHKQKYLDKARRNSARSKQAIYEWLFNYFLEHSCVDCPEKDPIVLEFDHRDGEKKTTEVSNLIRNGCTAQVKKEVMKCDVRCANCHRRRTAKQRKYFWIKFLSEKSFKLTP